ncbi:MAG: thiamine pyrophosphate-dependent enzyme, partial [Gammaproteobacteria bacterium]
VEYIFSSPGSEWPPLWEALAEQKAQGIDGPTYINIRHEDTAAGVAIGYAKATGKLAVCVVHASVGTLHAAMGIRAAHFERTPVLFCAGESVTFGEGDGSWVGSQWGRYLADYGGPARVVEPFTKASYGLPTPNTLAGATHRACQMAMNAPQGPVFLSLPFEYLAQPAPLPAPPGRTMPRLSRVEPDGLAEAARLLADAKSPLIITENIGSDPRAVKQLVALAEMTGSTVVEAQTPGYVNFPREHDLHGGFNASPLLPSADVVLLLDCIVPWYPPSAAHPQQGTVISISADPLHERAPYHGISSDLTLVGDAHAALADLLQLMPNKLRGKKRAVAARSKKIGAANQKRRARWQKICQAQKSSVPIDTRWFALEFEAVLNKYNAILVDETILTHWTLGETMNKLKPGNFYNALSGGLGLGMGVGMGVKIAHPDRPVVTIVGDGTFNYNAPLPALGLSTEYGLPMLTVVANNGHYRSMKMGIEMLYPKGVAAKTGTYYGAEIDATINYSKLAEAVGGYGEEVSDPKEIRPALERAFDAMRDGKPAVLDVKLGDDMEFLAPMFAKLMQQ